MSYREQSIQKLAKEFCKRHPEEMAKVLDVSLRKLGTEGLMSRLGRSSIFAMSDEGGQNRQSPSTAHSSVGGSI